MLMEEGQLASSLLHPGDMSAYYQEKISKTLEFEATYGLVGGELLDVGDKTPFPATPISCHLWMFLALLGAIETGIFNE